LASYFTITSSTTEESASASAPTNDEVATSAPNNDELELQNENESHSKDDESDVTAALQLKKEIFRKLMEIHGDSTFTNVDTFEEEEEDNDMENEVEDDASHGESISAQSTKKESAKSEYFYRFTQTIFSISPPRHHQEASAKSQVRAHCTG